jgi:hypothetical protein
MLGLAALALPAVGGDLVFRTGFEAGTVGVGGPDLKDLTGSDGTVPGPNDWVRDLEGYPSIGDFNIEYVAGSSGQRGAGLVDDPTGSVNPVTRAKNRVLRFWTRKAETAQYTARVQTQVYGNHDLTEATQRVRMYLHPDIRLLESYPGTVNWFTLQEMFPRPAWTGTPDSYRMGLQIIKDGGAGKKFYFRWNAEQQSPTVAYWSAKAQDAEVPFGKWFTAETYYRMGDKNTGRLTFSIAVDGGPMRTIIDVHDATTNANAPLTPLLDWCPHKLYVNPLYIDYVTQRGGTVQVFWDDWELWAGKPGTVSLYAPRAAAPDAGETRVSAGLEPTWAALRDALGRRGHVEATPTEMGAPNRNVRIGFAIGGTR